MEQVTEVKNEEVVATAPAQTATSELVGETPTGKVARIVVGANGLKASQSKDGSKYGYYAYISGAGMTWIALNKRQTHDTLTQGYYDVYQVKGETRDGKPYDNKWCFGGISEHSFNEQLTLAEINANKAAEFKAAREANKTALPLFS